MAAHNTTTPAQDPTSDRRLVVKVPEDLLKSLRTSCVEKSNVSLLGRIQGKHPGLKALTAWARDTLHPSLVFLSLKANNLFEITFSSPEGRIHALTQTELTCEAATISFSSWRPHFDAKAQQPNDQLDFPIWLQVVDLCQILREDAFLRTIGEHIGQVIAIDNSEAYRAKLFGPRIRILVKDLNNLPHTVVLPRLDGEGVVEYNLEYSGLPHQCGRCRSRDHQVRHCPKKESKIQRRDHLPRNAQQPPVSAPEPTIAKPTEPAPATATDTSQDADQSVEIKDNTGPQLNQALETPKSTHPVADSNPTDTQGTPSLTTTTVEENPPELQPNDQNFPQLQSPEAETSTPQHSPINQPGTPHTFVWRMKSTAETQSMDKGKEKLKQPNVDSAPLTRQGYRSGRLADDFWEVLAIPGTPSSQRKRLRILPFLTKNSSHTEYLVDNSKQTCNTITTVNIAELLAGVPWTLQRARQHIVNAIAQALHKVLIFNNQHNTPFHKWEQGKWFSQWSDTPEGDKMCTCFVSVAVPESKIKIRKGRAIGWKKVPAVINAIVSASQTDLIQDVEENGTHWQEMAGLKVIPTPASKHTPTTTFVRNPFAVLSEEEDFSS